MLAMILIPDPVQDGGGLAVGSDGEDPDNHGKAESDAGRTQSVNDPSLFSVTNDNLLFQLLLSGGVLQDRPGRGKTNHPTMIRTDKKPLGHDVTLFYTLSIIYITTFYYIHTSITRPWCHLYKYKFIL